MKIDDFVNKARVLVNPNNVSKECITGEVAAAIETVEGHFYFGISISAACGIGFCAEHSAIAQMITKGETEIKQIVAINSYEKILPPCGRCRELMFQINPKNLRTKIIIAHHKILLLEELLPERWQDFKYNK